MRSVFLGVLLILVSLFGTVTVLAPNGGETVTRGDQFEITWSDDISEDVKIELYQNGIYNSDIISATPSDGSFIWNLVTGIYGTDFQVKISSTVMPALHSDISDGMFTIEREEGLIDVVFPNGSELLERGQNYEILWTDNIPEAIKIELYMDGFFLSTISDSTDSDGVYEWIVPCDLSGTNFKIAITSLLEDSISGMSEYNFVVKKGSIVITYPETGTNIGLNENFPVVWTDDVPEDILLSLYKNSILISSFRTPSTGNCKWNNYLKNLVPGDDYSLKLESSVYSEIYYETGLFTISGTQVSGKVEGVWQSAGSPYVISDSAYVDLTDQLTIEPGVRINGAKNGTLLNLKGRIDAEGNCDNLIVFEDINLVVENSLSIDSSAIKYSKFTQSNVYNVLEPKFFAGYSGYCVTQTQDGGYAIAGSSGIYQNGNGILIKTDSNGALEWNKSFGGLSDDQAYSVLQTPDGGLMVCGYTKSYGSGGYDAWVFKTDILGNLKWSRTYGGPEDDKAFSICKTSEGGYAIAGNTKSYGAGGSDAWLIKIDSSGNMEWSKTFGGVHDDSMRDLKQTSDGGFIMTGTNSSGGTGYYSDIWLVKTDSFGEEEWNTIFGDEYFDGGMSVQKIDNGYILTGYWGDPNMYDVFLIKTDLSGNIINETRFNNDWDQGCCVQQTRDGGFIIAGILDNYAWVIKTDTDTGLEWQKEITFENPYPCNAQSIIQTSDGGYIITGGNGDDLIILMKLDAYGNYTYSDGAVTINNNSKAVIQNCIISNFNNYGLLVNNASPVVSNNLITSNLGGIKFINSSPQYIVNNTIADNDSIGLYFDGNSDGQFVNNIIYGNKIKEVYIKNDLSDPAFYYNDIKGGQAGFGLYSGVVYSGTYANNISSDPMFTSVGFYLSETSPCIDAGYPGLTDDLLGTLYIPQTALLGNPRIYAEEIDIGCYEWNANGIEEENTVGELTLYQNYPNPFNPVTTIKYSVTNDSNVKLNVFDITGREVCKLVDRMHSKGVHEVNFSGEMLSSGIYFYRLSVGDKFVAGRKMMLLK